MPNYRKIVRDAARGFLADGTNGFNAKLSALAGSYGITPFTITWTSPTRNFSQTFIESVEESPILDFPGAALYTREAGDTGVPRALSFSGDVMLCLDFWIRYRTGVEAFDSESILDAVEDAALAVLNAQSNAWPAGVLFARETTILRDPLLPLGDGWQHKISISSRFAVRIT